MKKNLFLLSMTLLLGLNVQAKTMPFGKGQLTVTTVARNAVRVQYAEGEVKNELPDWLYVKHGEVKSADVKMPVGSS